MSQQNPLGSEFIISFMTLRKAVGYIGISMPIIVRLGAYVFEGIPSNESISAYYYTVMRDVFVGTLSAIGVFLFCYRGLGTQDNVMTNIAGLAAIGIGLFPVDPTYHHIISEKFPATTHPDCYQNHGPLGYHIYIVSAFFVIISYLVIFRFTMPGQPVITQQKRMRNKVYIICGIIMLVSLGAIVLLKAISRDNPIFWPETIAIIAFGVAWLAKGQAILKDQIG
jgi:uncharacterized protein YhhL (DUF1145 family)